MRDPLRAAGEELAAKFLPPGLFVGPGAQQLEIDPEPLARRLVDIAPVARPVGESGAGSREARVRTRGLVIPIPDSRFPTPLRQARFFGQLVQLALLAGPGRDHLDGVAAPDR